MNKFAFEIGRQLVKQADVPGALGMAWDEIRRELSKGLFGWPSAGLEKVPLRGGGRGYMVEPRTRPPIEAEPAGALGGLLGGGVGGGALGLGAGGLLHYMLASEQKRRIRDYLKSMLLGGAAGMLGGGALGSSLGASVGREQMTMYDELMDMIRKENLGRRPQRIQGI